MSLKGSTITSADVKVPVHVQRQSQAEQNAFVDGAITAHERRWRIVGHATDGTPMIREEIHGRLLKELTSPKARRILGMLLSASPAVRKEVVQYIDPEGTVVYPWPLDLDDPEGAVSA